MTVSTSETASTAIPRRQRGIERVRLASMLAPGLTILLSSFLLFLVQPILAKQILPWFGGSAGVWTICLVFFQLVLLLGYTYAHWLRGAGSRQFGLHISLLLVSSLTLPIIPGAFWKADHGSQPAVQILGLLCTTVGLPYFLLASTAPLLQRWLGDAVDGSSQRRSIYRLFALSNLGSLFGLLSYPFAIEPFATLRTQAWVWSCAYALFVACSISFAWHMRRQPAPQYAGEEAGAAAREAPPSLGRYAYWIACAALGSALLLSATNQITQNVAPVPLLWIVPLSMYLLSFVICFEGRSGRGWYDRSVWVTPAMLAAGAMAWALFADGEGKLSIYVAIPVFTVGLLLGCVVCHGELARSKPNPRYLTHFYLSLATGGALGGLLVGLVAPRVFDGYWEMPLALVGLTGLGFYCCREELRHRPKTSWTANLVVAGLATTLIHLLLGRLLSALDQYALPWAKVVQGDAVYGCAALLVVSALLLQQYRLWRAVALTALLCTLSFDWSYYHGLSDAQFAARNFYGTLRVIETPYGSSRIRTLTHGVILHGSQLMEPAKRDTATTYFGVTSGIGRTLLAAHRTVGPLRIGSVGLGAGTLAAYGLPGDVFRVYELNPAVKEIAENQFTFLKDSKARVQVVLGDARLSLEREIAQGAFNRPEQRFDVLSLDAFSGDAIPVHLLTAEAFATYVRVTKPDGVIAFHLTNRYLNLPPVVEQIARTAGFQAVLVADRPRIGQLTESSDWVLVTRNTAFLRDPELSAQFTSIIRRSGLPLWTDQFSNLLQILK